MKKFAVLATILATLALGVANANAVVTVGSPLTATFTSGGFDDKPITLTNVVDTEPGARLTSPVTGKIIRWHVVMAEGGPFYLRILRPSGSDFIATGTSGPATPTSTGLQTFSASLPIQAGEAIGLEAHGPNTSSVGFAVDPGFESYYWEPALTEGTTSPAPAKLPGEIAAFNAEVQPTPSLAAIAPATGSVTGGTAVTIVGSDFESVSAVKFGDSPSASFTVDSTSKITAIAPKAAAPGEVDISVTTAGGTTASGPADKFKYEACTVPKLGGKRLKAARASLKAGNCALGKVTRKGKGPAKKARVVKQSAKPGTLLAPGSAIKVTLRSKAPKAKPAKKG
ncbi:MAG TPA: IPT/TIG domain-containing protein [Solirubrobacterales bacterium]|jgi:hypothetical protein|nr:IPT/TIG domain-containing protein [Solirubrobacterales bacterium]